MAEWVSGLPDDGWIDGPVDNITPVEDKRKRKPGAFHERMTILDSLIAQEKSRANNMQGTALSYANGALMGFGDELGRAFLPDSLNQQQELFEKDNPGISMLANMAGGVTSGGMLARQAMKIPALLNSPILAGAGIGATEGLLSGAGYSDEDRLGGAARGLALGGAFPLMTGLGGYALRKGFNAAFPQPNNVVKNVVNSSLDDTLSAAEQSNKATKILRAASGKTESDLGRNVLNTRAQGVSGRIQDSLDEAIGLQSSRKASQNMDIYKMSKEAGEAYDHAFKQTMDVNDNLLSIANTPAGKNAVLKAEKMGLNKRLNVDESSVQYWHQIKRALGDQVSSLKRGGYMEDASDVMKLKDDVTKELNKVPQYSKARELWAGKSDIQDAFDLGSGFLQESSENLSEIILNKSEKIAYVTGLLSSIRKTMERSPEESKRLFSFMRSIGFKKKMTQMIGKTASEKLQRTVNKENNLMTAVHALRSGSETADNESARRLLETQLSPIKTAIKGVLDISPKKADVVVDLLSMPAGQAKDIVNQTMPNTVARQIAITHPLATQINSNQNQ